MTSKYHCLVTERVENHLKFIWDGKIFILMIKFIIFDIKLKIYLSYNFFKIYNFIIFFICMIKFFTNKKSFLITYILNIPFFKP